jgi:hypothetical protein
MCVGISFRSDTEARYDIARARVRGFLAFCRERPPVDVEAIIQRAGVPVVEHVLAVIGLLEPQRLIDEREAKPFAAELLMPFFEVRRRWLALSLKKPVEGELSVEDKVQRLAEEFGVTPMAMRVRTEQMKLVRT